MKDINNRTIIDPNYEQSEIYDESSSETKPSYRSSPNELYESVDKKSKAHNTQTTSTKDALIAPPNNIIIQGETKSQSTIAIIMIILTVIGIVTAILVPLFTNIGELKSDVKSLFINVNENKALIREHSDNIQQVDKKIEKYISTRKYKEHPTLLPVDIKTKKNKNKK